MSFRPESEFAEEAEALAAELGREFTTRQMLATNEGRTLLYIQGDPDDEEQPVLLAVLAPDRSPGQYGKLTVLAAGIPVGTLAQFRDDLHDM